MCERHQGRTRQTESVSHRAAGCRQLNEQDFCVRKRKELFSRTQKIAKLNITTQRKKLTLSIRGAGPIFAPGLNQANRTRHSQSSWLQTTQRTRFLSSEKERTVFNDPKDRQGKHYYPKKKLTLSIRSSMSLFEVHVICIYEKSFL